MVLRAILLLICTSSISLIAGNKSFGSEIANPKKLEQLGIHDPRSGYRCPDGSSYLDRLRGLSLSRVGYNIFDLYPQYKDKETYTGKTIRVVNGEDIIGYELKFELLTAKENIGFSEDQLQSILEFYMNNDSASKTSYRITGKKGGSYVLKNSEGKVLSMNSFNSIYSKGKQLSINRTFDESSLKCTDDGTIHGRTIQIFNDNGDQLGEVLKYPSIVIITDVFVPSVKVNNTPVIEF